MGEPNCTGLANHRAVDTVFDRAGEPPGWRTTGATASADRFIILEFFYAVISSRYYLPICVKAKTNNNSKLHISIYINMIHTLQK